jgi:hypothetical protein
MTVTTTLGHTQPVYPLVHNFDPADFIEYYADPFAVTEEENAWREEKDGKGKGKMLVSDSTLIETTETAAAIEDVDWRDYNPPKMLLKIPTTRSETIKEVVSLSIHNIKQQVVREKEQERLLEEGRQKLAAEEAAKATKEPQEPYLPIIIRKGKSPAEDTASISTGQDSTLTPTQSSIIQSAKHQKRRRFALARIFNRSNEKGESSKAGASRSNFLSAYYQLSINGTDLASNSQAVGGSSGEKLSIFSKLHRPDATELM